MTTTSTTPPLPAPPRYGAAALSDLLPAVLAGMGVTAEPPAVALPPAPRVVVLLVDGLGDLLLRTHGDAAPFLASLDGGQVLTAGFPSTTATSLTSLGTGRPPGEHGLVGYQMWLPELGRRLDALRWDPAVDAHLLQPLPTVFERAAQAGVAVGRVGPRAFHGSGLTEAGTRGGDYFGANSAGELVAAAAHAARRGTRSLVYVYYGDLDATGHRVGCESAAWRFQLAHVDRVAEQLASALPDDALLLVTADHGMLDVPPGERHDLALDPALDAGVRLLAGEPRATYVHVEPGAQADVVDTWREVLGGRAWVVTRDEAVEAGWFGHHVTPRARGRIGDVVMAAREPIAVVDSRWMAPSLLALVGMHGSLTEAELLVPLLPFARA